MERTVLPFCEPEILAPRLASSVAAIGAASLPTMQTAGTGFPGKTQSKDEGLPQTVPGRLVKFCSGAGLDAAWVEQTCILRAGRA